MTFNIGDIVEVHQDSGFKYWIGATGPVVEIDDIYVYADLTTTSGKFSARAGFQPLNYCLVSGLEEFIPDI